MKTKRHNKILEIIERENIETQEELISRLRASGYDVTQATVSRDIRELKLTKVMGEDGIYRYMIPSAQSDESTQIYSGIIAGSVKSVDFAGNCVVIKTYPGMANAVAAGIDTLSEPDILGCVAGDDAIIIVVRTAEGSSNIAARIRSLI